MKVISVKIYGATKEKLLAFLQNLFFTEDFYILIQYIHYIFINLIMGQFFFQDPGLPIKNNKNPDPDPQT